MYYSTDFSAKAWLLHYTFTHEASPKQANESVYSKICISKCQNLFMFSLLCFRK